MASRARSCSRVTGTRTRSTAASRTPPWRRRWRCSPGPDARSPRGSSIRTAGAIARGCSTSCRAPASTGSATPTAPPRSACASSGWARCTRCRGRCARSPRAGSHGPSAGRSCGSTGSRRADSSTTPAPARRSPGSMAPVAPATTRRSWRNWSSAPAEPACARLPHPTMEVRLAETPLAIQTHNLSRSFGGVPALDELTLEVGEGSFFGYLGPNGAGKSTTINILTGLLAPDGGSARVLGLDVETQSLEIKRRIGVVPDGLHLFERLSGEEHLRFVGEVHGLSPAEARRRAGQLLEAMDLTADAGKLVSNYSHGMRKKLALSCALIHEPRLLFLDEPFEGVDAVATRELRELLQKLVATRRMTVFLTSHVLEVVEKLCTHVGIIVRGKLAASGTLEELRRGPDGAPRSLEELFMDTVGATREDASVGLDWLTHTNDPA